MCVCMCPFVVHCLLFFLFMFLKVFGEIVSAWVRVDVYLYKCMCLQWLCGGGMVCVCVCV